MRGKAYPELNARRWVGREIYGREKEYVNGTF